MPTCPSCGQRKGRRRCPALGQDICPICCGTKRLSEIDCPENCVHLGAARAHPASIVRKQQEKDVAAIMPSIARHKTDGLSRLLDIDVAEASATTAATLETAARGVIYEHAAASLPAQRLGGEMRALLAEMREAGASVYDGEAAIVLRAVEQGARASGGETTYLELMGRILQTNRAARSAGPPSAARPATQSLIIP